MKVIEYPSGRPTLLGRTTNRQASKVGHPLDPITREVGLMFKEQVEQVLESLRPMLALHRGNVELVEADERTGVVKVKFLGTCSHCPLSEMTLKGGIESELKEHLPNVTEVIAV